MGGERGDEVPFLASELPPPAADAPASFPPPVPPRMGFVDRGSALMPLPPSTPGAASVLLLMLPLLFAGDEVKPFRVGGKE